jgi:hypothetical protein
MRKEASTKTIYIQHKEKGDSDMVYTIGVDIDDTVKDIKQKLRKKIGNKSYRCINIYRDEEPLGNELTVEKLFNDENQLSLYYDEIKDITEKNDEFVDPSPVIRSPIKANNFESSSGYRNKNSSGKRKKSKKRLPDDDEEGEIRDLSFSPQKKSHKEKRKYSENLEDKSFTKRKQRHSEIEELTDKVCKKRKYSDTDSPTKKDRMQRLDLEEGEIDEFIASFNENKIKNNISNYSNIEENINTAVVELKKLEELGNFNYIEKENESQYQIKELSSMFDKVKLNDNHKEAAKKKIEKEILKLRNMKQTDIMSKKAYVNFYLNTFNLNAIRLKKPIDHKLNLILDIDSTILFSELLDINSEVESDKPNETFIITPKKESKLRFKIRKGFAEFLTKLSQLCNIYISTHAQEFYALDVVRVLNEEYGVCIKEEQVHSVKFPSTVLSQKTLR